MMQIFVRNPQGNTSTLNVEKNESIYSVKKKLQEETAGIHSYLDVRLIYAGKPLENWLTLADYNILKECTLHLCPYMGQAPLNKPSTKITQVKPLPPEQAPLSTPQPKTPCPATQTKTPRPATQTTPNSNSNTHSIINETNDGEYIQGSATCAADRSTYQTKLKVLAHHQAKATAALSDLMPEFQNRPSSSELEDLKREMASKERELEATISKLKHEHASYESKIIALEAQDKKTKQELMVARSMEKEQVATISRLTHKIKVFSGQYESRGVALEAEIKRTRAAAYAEGLKGGKAKRLKSVEFLHHLTDASMQYFDYGFDSCEKQAEQQGFVGQLNKESALKDAPGLKGWKISDP